MVRWGLYLARNDDKDLMKKRLKTWMRNWVVCSKSRATRWVVSEKYKFVLGWKKIKSNIYFIIKWKLTNLSWCTKLFLAKCLQLKIKLYKRPFVLLSISGQNCLELWIFIIIFTSMKVKLMNDIVVIYATDRNCSL